MSEERFIPTDRLAQATVKLLDVKLIIVKLMVVIILLSVAVLSFIVHDGLRQRWARQAARQAWREGYRFGLRTGVSIFSPAITNWVWDGDAIRAAIDAEETNCPYKP